MKNTSDEMPRFTEPWFLVCDASVEFLQTITPEDPQKTASDETDQQGRQPNPEATAE